MAKRSKVELFEEIRKAADAAEESGYAGAGQPVLGPSPDGASGAGVTIPPPRKAAVRPSPLLDPWKSTIDGWLADDEKAPKKQRHTARRVFQRLLEEHGAEIGESTVRRYVAEVKARRPVVSARGQCAPVPPARRRGRSRLRPDQLRALGEHGHRSMFVMRLSASGKAFHRIYANEAQEVFIDGHVRAFEQFGGVPGRIRYDNLKPAVVRVLKGRDRKETERFVAMRSHYGFDSFFCLPGIGGAHEKGGVEGEVGRFRRRHLVPLPKVETLCELNELIALADDADDARHIFGHVESVGAEFAHELSALRPLPAERFEMMLALHPRVDTKSRVSVRQCFYSVPARFVGRRIDVYLGAEHVEAREDGR